MTFHLQSPYTETTSWRMPVGKLARHGSGVMGSSTLSTRVFVSVRLIVNPVDQIQIPGGPKHAEYFE